MSGCVFLWVLLAYCFKDNDIWIAINKIVVVIALIAILFVMLFTRSVQKHQITLQPFAIFDLAKVYPDVYSQMVLNVVLFLPFGLSMPFCVKDRVKHPALVTIVTALLLSVIVEILQYVFSCGYSEIDDVMLNVFGAFLGMLSYVFADILKRERVKRKNKVG